MIRGDFPIPAIVVEPFGNWQEVEARIAGLPRAIKASAVWGQRKAAEKLVKIVKGHIDNQDLGWTPLKRPELSGDPRILVDYGTYRDNIKTWQKNYTRYVGVKKDVINHRGERVWMVAALHEFMSYHGGPYRPLWGPSVEELGGSKGIAGIIEQAISRKLNLL